MRAASRLGLGGAIAASTLLACQLLVGVKDDPGAPLLPERPPAVDGGPTPGDPCVHARPPPKPTVNDGNEELELVFAARKVAIGKRVGGNDGGQAIGFDLDEVCSCENAPRDAAAPRTLCKLPPGVDLCAPGKPTDDPFGRDLGVVQATGQLSTAFDQSASIDGQLERGERGLLVLVSNYNGKANDSLVRVSFALAAGPTKQGACGDASAPLPDAGDGVQRYQPCWDGNDEWPVLEGNARTLDGWVNNYELVVEDPKGSTKVYLGIGSIQVELAGPVFQATLVPPASDKPWVLDGVLAGRIDANATLATVGALVDPLEKPGLICEHTIAYGIARSNLCAARDIPFRGEDPTRTCDGISAVVGVRLEGARKGPFMPAPPTPITECDAASILRCEP